MPTPPPAAHELLVCPLCGDRLDPAEGALRCPRRHTFNIARQGYVSLAAGGAAASADDAAMVEARSAFLGAGHYAQLARALARTAASVCAPDAAVLDAGTGTGYYLSAVLDALPEATGLGMDTSKFALRRAARAHPGAAAVSWDVWQPLPVRSGSVDLVLNVFAPRNGAEFQRVLRPEGALLVATPTVRHLAGLREHAGLLSVDGAKEERLHRALSGHFRQESAEPLEYEIPLSGEDLRHLVSMGPNAHHVTPEELTERLAGLDAPFPVTASFVLSVHRPM